MPQFCRANLSVLVYALRYARPLGILLVQALIANPHSAPPPDLRIVDIDSVLPHETSDIQRSGPLIERLRKAEHFTNPPIVAAGAEGKFVLMDGSNRHASMKALDFPHILVQVADYASDTVQLDVWQHVIADWDAPGLLRELIALPFVDIAPGDAKNAIAKIELGDGTIHSVCAAANNLHERNAALRRVVEAWHSRATLYRTPLKDTAQIWQVYPTGVALVVFPSYAPDDILAAAMQRAYLPPGISRHIIHGRALNLRYPMDKLRDDLPLEEKNRQLQTWLQAEFARRRVRYYAEATWQFDE